MALLAAGCAWTALRGYARLRSDPLDGLEVEDLALVRSRKQIERSGGPLGATGPPARAGAGQRPRRRPARAHAQPIQQAGNPDGLTLQSYLERKARLLAIFGAGGPRARPARPVAARPARRGRRVGDPRPRPALGAQGPPERHRPRPARLPRRPGGHGERRPVVPRGAGARGRPLRGPAVRGGHPDAAADGRRRGPAHGLRAAATAQRLRSARPVRRGAAAGRGAGHTAHRGPRPDRGRDAARHRAARPTAGVAHLAARGARRHDGDGAGRPGAARRLAAAVVRRRPGELGG